MVYELRKQPLRGLYLLFQAIVTPALRIPILLVLSLPKSNRGRSTWDLKRAVIIKLLQHVNTITAKSGILNLGPMYNHRALAEGANVKGVWVVPTPQLITGEVKKWAEDAKVEYIRIPGYWIDKPGKNTKLGDSPQPGEKVLYALHGGGFENLSAHPSDITANIARGIITHADSIHRAFGIEYRLSTGPPDIAANPFPAALIDIIAGYNYLVNEVGFSPENIVVEGDSAGGNLALALVRYLIENQTLEGLPGIPGRLILCSPWGDIGESDIKEGCSIYTNASSDYLAMIAPRMQMVKNNYCGPLGYEAASTNRYISPGSQSPKMEETSFEGFPRTFIVGGGAEVLIDQIRALGKKMKEDLGDEGLEFFETPDGVHDYLVFVWFEPERTETLKQIASWLTSN